MDTSAVSLIQLGFNLCRFYLAIGLLFSVLFVIFWVGRIDHTARGGSIGFRILIIPGLSVLWPIFALRLIQGKETPTERTAHRLRAE